MAPAESAASWEFEWFQCGRRMTFCAGCVYKRL